MAPDGNEAYALSGAGDLLHLHLRSGRTSFLLPLPGTSVGGLAVTDTRVYAPHTWGSAAWTIDRTSGRLVRTTAVGRHPNALTLSVSQ